MTPSNPYAELIERLRVEAAEQKLDYGSSVRLLAQAAEAISQLTRDVEEARAALTEIEARCHMETRQGLLEIVTAALTRLAGGEK